MPNSLTAFEKIVRSAINIHDPAAPSSGGGHPFEQRNIHPKLPAQVVSLFDNGHYAQATFEAFKYLDKEVHKASGLNKSGAALMMSAFGGEVPPIALTAGQSNSEKDEQEGFKFIFAGSVMAIRNPRGHEYEIHDDPDTCLDHLSMLSMLLRRLEDAEVALS